MQTASQSGKPVLLWASDSEELSALDGHLLLHGYAVETVADADGFLDRLATRETQVALLDVSRAARLTTEQAQQLRHLAEDVPLIGLSTLGDTRTRLAAVRLGCKDFIPLTPGYGTLLDSLDRFTSSMHRAAGRVLVVAGAPDGAVSHVAQLNHAGLLAQVIPDPMLLLDSLHESPPELILMDLDMPEANGEDLARVVRQHESWLALPIVFLDGTAGEERQWEVMAVGHDDLLRKPVEAARLISLIRSRIARYRALRCGMLRDGFTGLLGYVSFKERLRVEIARSLRTGHPVSLALLEIDQLDRVQATWGRPLADRVIRDLARLLGMRLRSTDVVGRYDMQRFALALPDTTMPAAYALIDMLRDSFSRLDILPDLRCTFSAGLARCPPHNDAEGLLQAAGEALQTARRDGRNGIAVAEALVE